MCVWSALGGLWANICSYAFFFTCVLECGCAQSEKVSGQTCEERWPCGKRRVWLLVYAPHTKKKNVFQLFSLKTQVLVSRTPQLLYSLRCFFRFWFSFQRRLKGGTHAVHPRKCANLFPESQSKHFFPPCSSARLLYFR
uniref:T. congolense-specific, cell surface-expressed gene family n=1 Tax=Trypanosoma congolense (strain IL3000) TaxID=1068625 RepID=F9WHT4_TRYCI|nr:hypothetical protein, unlikely [Trypanosoma congolense IL3000]